MRTILAAMPAEQKAAASAKIRAHLESLAVWKTAEHVFGFVPMASEPLWLPGDFSGRRFAFPRLKEDEIELVIARGAEDFVEGKHGLREPVGSHFMEKPDLILVPGLAFDRQGGRLGRGKGHYDRFLAHKTAVKIGVCFALQLVEGVPLEAHDHRLDGVVTEDGLAYSAKFR